MSTICASNVTSGFIDLATFDEIEKYMYGGSHATAYFVRDTRKSTWFTQVPVCLSKAAGNAGFSTEWSVSISRAGDYLLQTWLRLTLSSVTKSNALSADAKLVWTENFMHNLVAECNITFNDLVAARFDNFHLDFWSAFTIPASKRNGYSNMVGGRDFPLRIPSNVLPSATLNLPLPFFYGRDSGVALPTAALPYNEMRINFSFRDWTQLLSVFDPALVGSPFRPATLADVENAPTLSNVAVWANYAIVSNEERKRMACAPRDILIEQVQSTPRNQSFNPNGTPSYDVRFSHAIKVLFFAVRNKTISSIWSNYTSKSATKNGILPKWDPDSNSDPIIDTSVIYENTNRLANMGSDYFSLVNPFYHAVSIPEETGYHCYSYSLDFICLDPMGSTNYGKLTNVSIVPAGSQVAKDAADGNGADVDVVQRYDFVVTAINNNIIRISGGALGFPVL